MVQPALDVGWPWWMRVRSKQVSALEDAAYVKVRKGYVGERPRTWLALAPVGRDVCRQHLDALREIAGQ